MGTERTRLLAHDSVYWININTNIKNMVKQHATCMEYQQTQACEKIIPCKMPNKLWEVAGANILSVKNNPLLCIGDDYSKFSIVKKTDGLLADNLIGAVKNCVCRI